MISQLKFLLDIFLSANTVIIQFYLMAAVTPDKNETDYIVKYNESVKLPMGKILKSDSSLLIKTTAND
ncbi:MAG: hypothetical protein AMJ61_05990 [Desulfobacterales bacterium SG8_35_2]|nr:MAG: hypothetical protein AMJ61_05990 [Desulfobacterales bacterium SG8_35_2]